MGQRPPTIQQGIAEGKKRINTKLVSTSLPPHHLSFPFFFEKSKKSLCHSGFRALTNAIIQKRSARSSVMVNVYCQMHSYSILRASHIMVLARTSSNPFSKPPCAASHTLHSLSLIFLPPSAFPSSTTCSNPVWREAQQHKPACNILG